VQWVSALILLLMGTLQPQPARLGRLEPLPLTQLDERVLVAELDNRTLTLTFAQPVPIRDVLLQLVRGTNLSVVPESTVTGSFGGELKNVTVRRALQLVLPPLGLDYALDGTFIRVFRREPEQRIFDVNYVATERTGATRIGSSDHDHGASYVGVESVTGADLFAEISKGVATLLSERGTFNLDRKAGLLQVSDSPDRLERVSTYLDAVHDRVHRQVQIDARLIEVELSDPEAQSLDWSALSPQRSGSQSNDRPVGRLRANDLRRFLKALEAQGRVVTIATPHLLAMNNQPAVVRAVNTSSDTQATGRRESEEFTLSVTPQIAGDGVVTLSFSPIVTVGPPKDQRNQGAAARRESDSVTRLGDGETLVLGGFSRSRAFQERKTSGGKGWFGRPTVTTTRRVELLVLLTARIVSASGTR
jgi:MSHA biogenesis protein MshL